MRKTFLLFKKGNPEDPANYRPITCMNVIFKIFTSILKIKIEKRLKKNETPLSTFQFGARPGTLASKQALLVSNNHKELLAKKRTKYIEVYYDLAKAYDSVIHSTLIEKLKKKGIEKRVIKAIKRILEVMSIELFCG